MPFLEVIEIWSREPGPYLFREREVEFKVGLILELRGDEVRVGRWVTNDLVLGRCEVSGFHLRLYRENDRYVYSDVASLQVPIYNGETIRHRTRIIMEDNDTFNVGGVMLRYRETLSCCATSGESCSRGTQQVERRAATGE